MLSYGSSVTSKPVPTRTIGDNGRHSRHLFKFLTPAKIALLVIVHIYCTASTQTRHNGVLFTFLLREIQRPTEFCALASMKTCLHQIAFTTLSDSIYDCLVDLSWTLKTFDDFHTFLMSSSDYVVPRNTPPDQIKHRRPILTTSFLGRFVRKCRLEYVKLDFDAAVFLWNALRSFRATTAKSQTLLASTAVPFLSSDVRPEQSSDANVTDGSENAFGFQIPKESTRPNEVLSFISRDDIENMCILETIRLEKFESASERTNSEGLKELLSQPTSLPVAAHLIRMKQSICAGDYFNAVAHLHAYFDHCFSSQASAQDTPTFYQVALLHLAILHERFSNYADAAWAIGEAINAARENKDNASLLFSLAWLDQFVKRAHSQEKIEISISREESLQYLKVKAKEANLPHLLGVVTLLEARQLVRSGGSLVPVFENLLKTSYVTLLFNTPRSLCPQMTLQSVVWKRLGKDPKEVSYNQGHPNLASLYIEASLRYFCEDALISDGISAMTVKAEQELREGNVQGCLGILDIMKDKAQNDHHSLRRIDFLRTIAEFELAVGRLSIVEARAKLEILKALGSDDPERSIQIFFAEVEVAMLGSDPEKALTTVCEKSRKLNDSDGDMADALYLTLLNARILILLGQPARTISMLLRCVDLAEKHNIRLVYLSGIRLLAKVMNELGQHDQGYRILSAVMPFVIEARDCALEAVCYRTLAESLMARVDHDQSQRTLIRTFLQNAQNGYRLMQDVDGEMACWEKLAILFDRNGDTQSRDTAAREYLVLKSSIEREWIY